MTGTNSDIYPIHFRDGPYVVNRSDHEIIVRFILKGRVDYEARLEPGHFARSLKRYLAPWTIEIRDAEGVLLRSHRFDVKARQLGVFLDSRSLGDTLAWVPQVERYAEANPSTRVYLSHYWPELQFSTRCPNLKWVSPESPVPELYASVKIGYFLNEELPQRHRTDPRRIPLAAVATDILNIGFEERRPRFANGAEDRAPEKRVCFAMASTAGCKLWHYPNGWQVVVDRINDQGFEMELIQRESAALAGIVNSSGDRPIGERIEQLKRCALFIGPPSGLAWLAWAVGAPVVMIGGFSESFTEFQTDCYRVSDPGACHGCWNDTSVTFDRDDWDWCPRHRDTSRQFECSREITPEMVMDAVSRALSAEASV
jgi:autotransporter strand-loop-strand O-heptosyltransferase